MKAAGLPGRGVPEALNCGCFAACDREGALGEGFAGAAASTGARDRPSAAGTTFVMAADAPSAATAHNTPVTTVRLSTATAPPTLLRRSMP
ncbi:hypothetical protein GCM10017778_48250 [Streptomyces vinaceus]|nr:hypothetical protein GCM10017778_48250 [Streptomyces vinaceus]